MANPAAMPPRPACLQIQTQSELEARESFTVTDGKFKKDEMEIGPDGILSRSPEGGLVSTLTADDFEMGEELGRGASAVCRKAIHKPTGTPMAIKIINIADSSKRAQLVTELKTLVGAPCPQFVNMIDAFFHEGYVYIVLEFMDLGSIDNIQKKCGQRVPETFLSYMMREILLGLHVLHSERKQIHRDIKPGNILFHSNGAVKIGDFGISKSITTLLGQASTYVGTSLYMSPERLKGNKYDATADIWSVGIMAIELATGKFPYDTSGGLFKLMSLVTESPPPVPQPGGEFSPEFCDFLQGCLRLDHNDRPHAERLLGHPYLTTNEAQDRDAFVAWLHSL